VPHAQDNVSTITVLILQLAFSMSVYGDSLQTGSLLAPFSVNRSTSETPEIISTESLHRLPPVYTDFARPPSLEISIDDAVFIALDNNKYLNVLSFRPDLWRTRIHEAAASFDPIIEMGGIYVEQNSQLSSRLTAAGTSATSQLSQTFAPTPGLNDNVSWSKRLDNGAVMQLNYSGIYERLKPTGAFRVVNPAWRSGLSG